MTFTAVGTDLQDAIYDDYSIAVYLSETETSLDGEFVRLQAFKSTSNPTTDFLEAGNTGAPATIAVAAGLPWPTTPTAAITASY